MIVSNAVSEYYKHYEAVEQLQDLPDIIQDYSMLQTCPMCAIQVKKRNSPTLFILIVKDVETFVLKSAYEPN